MDCRLSRDIDISLSDLDIGSNNKSNNSDYETYETFLWWEMCNDNLRRITFHIYSMHYFSTKIFLISNALNVLREHCAIIWWLRNINKYYSNRLCKSIHELYYVLYLLLNVVCKSPLIKMFYFQRGYIIIPIIKWWKKLLILSQTSTAVPLKFRNG